MSWFEGLWRKKQQGNSSLEKKEPALSVPDAEVAATVKAAEVQREADNNEAELVLAKLRGELPASDQEHIDIPLVQEEKENETLNNERENHRQLMEYLVILRELEAAVGSDAPGELELSQPLFDRAFKRAAAAIKATNRHPNATELSIMSGLIVMVRDQKLSQLITIYDKKRAESAQKIKQLQGDKIVQVAQDALKKSGPQEM